MNLKEAKEFLRNFELKGWTFSSCVKPNGEISVFSIKKDHISIWLANGFPRVSFEHKSKLSIYGYIEITPSLIARFYLWYFGLRRVYKDEEKRLKSLMAREVDGIFNQPGSNH